MYRTPFVFAPLVLLIVAGLLLGGGLIIHQAGWSDGYQAAQLVDGGGSRPPVSYGFGGWGLLVALGLGFLVLLTTGKFLRLWAWNSAWHQSGGSDTPEKMTGAWPGRYWGGHRHWHHPHPAVPPWCSGWHQPPGEEPEAPASAAGAAPDRPDSKPVQ